MKHVDTTVVGDRGTAMVKTLFLASSVERLFIVFFIPRPSLCRWMSMLLKRSGRSGALRLRNVTWCEILRSVIDVASKFEVVTQLLTRASQDTIV
jgi:hypothetical protein